MKTVMMLTTAGLIAAMASAGSAGTAAAACNPAAAGSSPQAPVCLGFGALAVNSGSANTAIGSYALRKNANGHSNTAVGFNALSANTGARYNTAVGTYALQSNTTGEANTANGNIALESNTTGAQNTATGHAALANNITGHRNSALGILALYANTTGEENVAFGSAALAGNVSGSYNTSIGGGALAESSTGGNNVAVGFDSGSRQTGSFNTLVGTRTAFRTSGNYNIALGTAAGSNWTAGSNNIAIGNLGNVNDSGVIRIGNGGRHTATFIAGIDQSNVSGAAVQINASGRLGVVLSSARYKQDIKPMGDASSRLMQLRPVTFHYKEADESGNRPLQYGLIAEEVNEVMPDLVIRNDDGDIETVAYQMLPSLLLNEYQRQNRELADTRAKLAAMEADMSAMKLALERFAAAASQGNRALASVTADEMTTLK